MSFQFLPNLHFPLEQMSPCNSPNPIEEEDLVFQMATVNNRLTVSQHNLLLIILETIKNTDSQS